MGKRGSRGEETVELLLCITFGVRGSDTGSGLRLRDNEKTDTAITSPHPHFTNSAKQFLPLCLNNSPQNSSKLERQS